MPIVFCFIPDDIALKPSADSIARLLSFMIESEYVDNDSVYLDIAYESGHHRPGASTATTVDAAAAVLKESDEAELSDYCIENIRGTAKIPLLFENANQKNLSLVGWLAVRVFEQPYPLFDSTEDYTIKCSYCGHEANQRLWQAQGSMRTCPSCGQADEMHLLDFFPKVEFARFVLEISELVFLDSPPRLAPGHEFLPKLQETLGAELKPVWYEM